MNSKAQKAVYLNLIMGTTQSCAEVSVWQDKFVRDTNKVNNGLLYAHPCVEMELWSALKEKKVDVMISTL